MEVPQCDAFKTSMPFQETFRDMQGCIRIIQGQRSQFFQWHNELQTPY